MNKYGKITILSQERIKNKVLCKCDCGINKWINIFNLKKGDVLSCGCLKKEKMKDLAKIRFTGKTPKNFIDYANKKIGVITVLKRINLEEDETWYIVRCDCGNEFDCRISSLRRSNYKFCRCGINNHPLKKTLRKMIDRCSNRNNKSFKWYGFKQIKVFDEWVKYPIKFIKWSIENGWKKVLTIDRIDPEKGYFPENCQWITRSENCKKAANLRWKKKHSE